jgi:hypothetical protein
MPVYLYKLAETARIKRRNSLSIYEPIEQKEIQGEAMLVLSMQLDYARADQSA